MKTRRNVLSVMAAGAASLLTPIPALAAADKSAAARPIEVQTFNFRGMTLAVHSRIETLDELPGVGKLAEPLQIGVVFTTWDGEMFSAYAVVKDAYGEMFAEHGLSPDEAVDNLTRHLLAHHYGQALKASG